MNPETEDYVGEPVIEEKKTQSPEQEREGALEIEQVPEEAQREAIEKTLDNLREVFQGLRNYTLFGSAALYMNGRRLAERGTTLDAEIERTPGDIDIAVFKRDEMLELAKRLARVPGVELKNNGQPKRLAGEDAYRLKGVMEVPVEIEGEKTMVKYPIEAYLHSNIVTDRVANGTVRRMEGLNVLNLEGLRRQYERNLSVEGRIDENVEKMTNFLESSHPEAQAFVQDVLSAQHANELSGQSRSILDHWKINLSDMKDVLKLQEDINQLSVRMDANKREHDLQDSVRDKLAKLDVAEDSRNQIRHDAKQLDEDARRNAKALKDLIGQRTVKLAKRGTKTKQRLDSIKAALNPEGLPGERPE